MSVERFSESGVTISDGTTHKKRYKTKHLKFKKGTIEKLAELFDLPKDQLSGRLSGSRKVSYDNAKILTGKFKSIGILVPIEYWFGDERDSLRGLIREWYSKC